MKFLKGLIWFLLIVVVILLIIAFTSPKEMNVSVTKDLAAPPEAVFHQVNNVKNWNNWDVWHQMDPDWKLEYGEKVEGEGASYSWESKKKSVGSGSMEITASIPNEKVSTKLLFEGTEPAEGDILIEAAEDGGSKVTWTFHSKMGSSPVNRLMGRIMVPMVKKSFTKGLEQLDAYVAENPDAATSPGTAEYKIRIEEREGMNTIAIRKEVKISEMNSELFAQGYGTLMGTMEKQGLEFAGQPIAVFETWDEENDRTIMYLAIPVSGDAVADGEVIIYNLDAGKAIVADFYGPYEETGEAHVAIDLYMKYHNLEFKGPVWEEYVTDPQTVSDPSEVLTRIYYAIG